MSLVEKHVATVESIYLRVTADRLMVAHVLAFADALREEGISVGEYVAGKVDPQTLHCAGLSVRVTNEYPPDGRSATQAGQA